jgi:two-component system phosphate regulon sensor histidine kinase PhoR
MPEGLILLDSRKRVLLCNNSAKRFFCYSKDVLFENVWILIRDPEVMDAIEAAVAEGEPSSLEMRTAAGLTLKVSISPVESKGTVEGETCAAVMLVDMTAERQLAEQKQDFFANASHELKTPITSIMGFSEMLASGALKAEDQRSDVLKRIEKEAKRMSALIDDILQISNLESRSGVIEESKFDLSVVVREACASVSPMAGGERIAVELDLESVEVYANPRQLRDLCLNLIENAVKYNVAGGKVNVSLKSDGVVAALAVADTGIGIPAEHQSRVFERFYRVDAGGRKRVGGTGLGLSIVKHIVNLYGGEISIKSEEGVGTRIEARLPVTAAAGAAERGFFN